MTDAHAHLHSPQIADQLDSVVGRFSDAGGKYILNNSVDLESAQIVLQQARQHPEIILPAVGIQPEVLTPGSDVCIPSADAKWINRNIDELRKILEKNSTKIKALGETGLDYYWVKRNRLPDREKIFELQKKLFRQQIVLAVEFDLPIIVHCRDEEDDKQCEAETLELLAKHGKGRVQALFHSYTGSQHYLKDILNLGFYVSFNGIITYKNAENVRQLLDATPLDQLLLETDAPFLVPNDSRSRGIKTAEPVMVKEVAKAVAERKGRSVQEIWEKVDGNFERFVGL